MAEEAVADARAFSGAFDQPGNVGKHEFSALVANDAELRAKRREGVIADFRARVRDAVEESRLAGIGKADQASVGEELQAKPEPHFLACFTSLVLARSTVGRGLVAGVSATTHSTFEEDHPLSFACKIGEECAVFVVGEELRPDGNSDDEIVAASARAVRAGTAFAPRRAEVLGVAKVDERIQTRHRLEDDVAALTAVPAIRAAEFDELLAPEADGARAAGTRTDEDLGLVEKMHCVGELGQAAPEGNLSTRERPIGEGCKRATAQKNRHKIAT